ncbi:glycoside hydrolase family 15 protein [Agreia pratensis]|uniref:Glucoamylase (Glucan-1,4-alpha-glucosidase), GH15 family n=1 Tax=Agreia pratensis TaxID=150121 RepID=A0A1X7K9L8_9MICO|nr:glycoside hydrolase family 15 protein [Agreia pratensis]MBF4634182.1 glycoside hydrolase family 15 protein [Agreia pratensis]SMG37475.1 Glucoamylase (glucan-1,4-alpha-glucosidase), GH15 family [Agreia pratensis]
MTIRADGTVPLRSYGVIGDGRTIALIAEDGGVDWLPMPSMDATPVFGRLLDAEGGGAIDLMPVEDFTVSRRYVEGTNVLETTFTTDSGEAVLTDALVTGIAGRLPWTELARRVDGTRGRVRFRWRVAPGTCLSTASPWKQETTHGPVIRVDGVTVAVRGLDHGPRGGGDAALAGSFTTEKDSRHVVTVVGTSNEPLHLPVAANVDRGIDRTIENWQFWSREFSYDGPWSDEVHRSALALKLLIFSPTGAIAAAGTTSLPENPRGGKNWDYRFAWVRDVAYTLHALIRFGLREETHAAVAWLLTTIRKNGPELHIFYRLDGSLPSGVTMQDAPGWNGAGPVVTGNPASGQLQLGVYGDLFDVMRLYVSAGNILDAETGRLLASVADRACDAWRQKDAGMWELEDVQHYTSAKMGCWQALDAAVELCEKGQIPGDSARWIAEREHIREWIETNCWSEERQSYVAYPGSDELDTSVLLHASSGFDRGDRMSKSIDAMREELGRGPLLYRYSGADSEEGAFVACSFWMAQALACVGRIDESVAQMDAMIDLSNDVGIYSEMIDPDDLAYLGNLPQALSHLALVNAAITIEEITGRS